MDITATAYRILKYLNRNQPPFIVDTLISHNRIFKNVNCETKNEFNVALQSLVDKGLINETKADVSITPAGIDYFLKIEHQNEELAYESIFKDQEYSLLKYLYVNDWGVRIDEFPDIIRKKASEIFSGINDGPLINFLFSINEYIDENNNSYKLNYHGIQYYKHLTEKKKAEKEAALNQIKSMSADNINYFENGGSVGDMFIKNDTATKTISTIEQKPANKKWYIVARDEAIKILVASSIAFAFGLFTGAKSCNQNPLQNQIHNSLDSLNNTK